MYIVEGKNMNITKTRLQRIIREEFVRAALESSGHKITETRVNFLVEKLENGELDEGFFDKLGAAFGAGKKAWAEKSAEEKTQKADADKQKKGDLANKAVGMIAAKLKDLRDYVAKKIQDSGSKDMADAPDAAETMIVHSLVKKHSGIADQLKSHIKDETLLRNVMSDTPFGAHQRSRLGAGVKGTGRSGGIGAAVAASTGGTGTNESLELIKNIISEEYARIIIRKSGHKITEARVKHVAKKLRRNSVNEGIFDKISASISGEEGFLRKLQGEVDKKVSDMYADLDKKIGDAVGTNVFNGFFIDALYQLDPTKFMPKASVELVDEPEISGDDSQSQEDYDILVKRAKKVFNDALEKISQNQPDKATASAASLARMIATIPSVKKWYENEVKSAASGAKGFEVTGVRNLDIMVQDKLKP